jgi:hypothetical protein
VTACRVRAVRAASIAVLSCVLLAACGGSKDAGPTFDGVSARTLAAGPAHFRVLISIDAAGTRITAEENGDASFTVRRGHLYKQLPGGQFPQELVIIGPITYTNANVQAALADPSVAPWTRLDTRRLTAKQRRTQADELDHVIAPAYLSEGVATAEAGGKEADGTYRFSGVVDLARLRRRVPAAIATAVRNDYPATNFPATFWVDDEGRLSRVLVDYTTAKGTKVTLDTVYSDYGTKVDLTLPAPGKIKDITP